MTEKTLIQSRSLIGTGWAIGLESLVNFEFRADRPYRACMLCGRVYQTGEDRDERLGNSLTSRLRRQRWAHIHAREHPESLHRQLRLSGQAMLPEAAHKLAAFGLIDIGGLILDDGISAAYREASATPVTDADL